MATCIHILTNQLGVSASSDDEHGINFLRTSSLKHLGRPRKKKHNRKPQELLQLPDSAISAKTRSGVRYIAISIPIEYDRPENLSINTQYHFRPRDQKVVGGNGPIIVLNPANESAESQLPSGLKRPGDSGISAPPSPVSRHQTPVREMLGPEVTLTLETYYSQLNQQQPQTKSSENTPSDHVPPALNAIPSLENYPQTSIAHSHKDLNSDISSVSPQAHLSQAPSNAMLSNPPVHSASTRHAMENVDSLERVQQAKAPNALNSNRPLDDRPQLRPLTTSTLGVSNSEAESPILPTVFSTGTAKIIRSYSAAGISLIDPGPAPQRRLPGLPSHEPRPLSAPLLHARSSSTKELREAAGTGNFISYLPPIRPTDFQQTRRERVRAKKHRDMSMLRAQNSFSALGTMPTSASEPTIPQDIITTAPRNRLKPSPASLDQKPNKLSSIMVVADLEPIPEHNRPLRSGRKHGSSNATTYTPPNSSEGLTEEESDTTIYVARKRRKQSPSGFRTPTSTTTYSPFPAEYSIELQNRRQERRKQRNVSAKEKQREIESRLSRIEQDNRLLLDTLGGIAKSFGDLSITVVGGEFRRMVENTA